MSETGQPNRLTHEQAASRLSVSSATLARMRSNGTGPEYFKVAGRIWYDPGKIDEWYDQQRRTQTDQRRKPTSQQQTAA